VHKEYAQQLYAAILNNTAVACLVQQTREPVCSMAFRGLIEATSQRRANGEMTRGARAAYLNLLLVKREGLF